MSVRLVFSQAHPQKALTRTGVPVDVCGVVECALSHLIAEGALTKTQIILAVEEALTVLGPAVDIRAERRMLAMINTIAASPNLDDGT
ncbi:MAG: hypothetical protein ABMA14_14545 [Hyphomonadaceae bacterium]